MMGISIFGMMGVSMLGMIGYFNVWNDEYFNVFSSFQQVSQVGKMKFPNKIIENVSYCPHGRFFQRR